MVSIAWWYMASKYLWMLQATNNTVLSGYEYQWLLPTGVFRRDMNSAKEYNEFKGNVNGQIKKILSDAIEKEYITKPS